MEQDKVRAEFEAWHRDRYPAVDVRRQNLLGTYTLLIVEQRWECWQSSREAVVVELPPVLAIDPDEDDEANIDAVHMVNGMQESCRAAIHAAGIRTK